MSAEDHESNCIPWICRRCRERKGPVRGGGAARFGDNTMCFECYRALLNRRRSEAVTSNASPLDAAESPFRKETLTPRRIAHRSRMLEHLERAAST